MAFKCSVLFFVDFELQGLNAQETHLLIYGAYDEHSGALSQYSTRSVMRLANQRSALTGVFSSGQ